MNTRKKIYGFYFAALLNDWKPIINEQLTKLFNSNLFLKTEKLFIHIYYTDIDDLKKFKKFIPRKENIILSETNINEFEFGILKILKEQSKKNDFYCYYFHSKGVSKTKGNKYTSECIKSWRDYMEYFLIEKFEKSMKELETGWDAVGVKLRPTPRTKNGKVINELTKNFHFSGNFWWSKSDFIKKLPEIKSMNLNDRFNAEFWIGYGEGKLKCLHDSKQASYKSIITENYKIF